MNDTRTIRARRLAARQPTAAADEVEHNSAARGGDPTLAELGIPARYQDELQAAGIETLADLERAGDLTAIKGIGPKASGEIKAAIAQYRG